MYFCGDCGSALWHEGPTFPGLKILHSGVLDGEGAMESQGIKPRGEQFIVRRPRWLCAVDGASQTGEQRGRKELEKLQ